MSQCNCGGATETATATLGVHRLDYEVCKGCGRVGGEKLFLCGSMIGRGLAARQAFNNQKEKRDGRERGD